jgi:hypothetical protein
VFAFTSRTVTNIWAGIGRGLWAVSESQHDSVNKGRETKASKMLIGSFGLIYCSEDQSYSTPFVVLSEPTGVAERVWPETWIMPFRIRPLGNPSKSVRRADMPKLLPALAGGRSVDDLLQIRGVQTFNASEVPQEDWAILMKELVV